MRCSHCGLDNAGFIPSKNPDDRWGLFCDECKGYFSFVKEGRNVVYIMLKAIEKAQEEKKNE